MSRIIRWGVEFGLGYLVGRVSCRFVWWAVGWVRFHRRFQRHSRECDRAVEMMRRARTIEEVEFYRDQADGALAAMAEEMRKL